MVSEGADARRRRRLTTAIRVSPRELSIQLSLLNHRVSARLGLEDVDIDCLDLIARHGPRSPSALRDRTVELIRPYSGMNASMGQVCAGYQDAELQLLADFLRRTTTAAERSVTEELMGEMTGD
jgi:hypothetical protein